MTISILIPVYNKSQYIKRCLSSIALQDYTNEIECLLVDDGSNDDSSHQINNFL